MFSMPPPTLQRLSTEARLAVRALRAYEAEFGSNEDDHMWRQLKFRAGLARDRLELGLVLQMNMLRRNRVGGDVQFAHLVSGIIANDGLGAGEE